MERLSAGQKLARLRKMRGWTQQQLADAVDISRVYLNRIEHDQTANVRPLFLDTAARAVGVESWAALEALPLVVPGVTNFHSIKGALAAHPEAFGLSPILTAV